MSGSRLNRVIDLALGEGYEFWRTDAKRRLRGAALALLANGFTEQEAADLISCVWSASAEEYGE